MRNYDGHCVYEIAVGNPGDVEAIGLAVLAPAERANVNEGAEGNQEAEQGRTGRERKFGELKETRYNSTINERKRGALTTSSAELSLV